MLLPDSPAVTIGVPVYGAESFVEEALESIARQTHRNLSVIVSLDGPQPEAERLCRPFLRDSRFRLVVQPTRLGWVGNLNWLMARATTPFWCCQPHDDLVDPLYVELLLDQALQRPAAAVVYCDIATFGLREQRIVQPSVTGDAVARQRTLLLEHLAAVAFRGLTRIEALRSAGGLKANAAGDFAADTVWMAAVSRWGELRRLPVEMYRKRYHGGNEHMKWFSWPADRRSRAWMIHCADMLEQAMLVAAALEERQALFRAAVHRLVSCGWGYMTPGADAPATEASRLFDAFYCHLQTTKPDLPSWLEGSWEDVRFAAQERLDFEVPT